MGEQSSKVDLYSAGIVFFEMLRWFSTGMERVVGSPRYARHTSPVNPGLSVFRPISG